MTIAIVTSGSIAGITTYDELQTFVAKALNRGDLAGEIPVFVQLVEARLNRLLRDPDMEIRTQITTADEFTPLPLLYGGARSIHVVGRDRPLDGMTPSDIAAHYSGVAGPVSAYAISGRDLQLAPPPPSAVTLELVYWQRFDALGDTNQTNWLLAEHPDIYYYGTLAQAEAFLWNDERVPGWKSAFEEAIEELRQDARKRRWGAAPLVARSRIGQVRGCRT